MSTQYVQYLLPFLVNPTGFKFTELHALNLAARSYALLIMPLHVAVESNISGF